MYMCIPDRVIITDSDGMGPYSRVYVVGCMSALTVVPYRRWVMSAPIPGRGAGHAYPENGSSEVGWLDSRVPPGLG
jgi:hypothetical protein